MGIDTGRLVALQAVDAGLTVDLLLPEPAFARWSLSSADKAWLRGGWLLRRLRRWQHRRRTDADR